ncbi:4-hydroxy-4-methyl-2-oxoglutarate aldolase [Skermanella stibiiresistens SB22]|uniref:Putative 4-hydroxy-4-methyl-2-oxoglutarate aldolase n=1 Tax=Skermanella stibiiresistens SB22 TaxID=1385369 RepID=W9H3G9_9PROT|nr:4-hydroxy-4-methyl-2-oxoglutarate aldolase [Skermanella stibiiresistens]EWY38313.1 4-hydroxy-4-methyl-2-oxoglutarate aldolase [Skermanella stibiiresistens SB22]
MYTINDMPEQLPAEDLALLAEVETATVGHWRLFGFMDYGIKPLLRGKRIVGTAVTLAIPGADSTLLHHAAGLLRPGDVLVVDRLGDDRHACWGGGVTIAAKAAGAVAGIVDGPCTDLAEIEDSDFPMWARGVSPITTRLYDIGGGLNIAISCGGVPVMPGDAVLADESGVLVLPRAEVRAVATEALRRQSSGREREATVRHGAKLGELTGASAKVLARMAP